MIIPEQVKILYKYYNVRKTENLHDGEDDLYGIIEHGEQTIDIDPQYSWNQQKCTLIHEVIHGLDDLYGIGLKEKQVERLGIALYQFIEDNPHIFKE